jgi:pilus assembly protein Flp/PilA
MFRYMARLTAEEEGATMLEYGLMVALIAVVCIAAIGVLGGSTMDLFDTANDTLTP